MRSIINTLSLVKSSLLNRRATALLTIASIAVSVALLSGVNRVRTDAQSSFTNTISGYNFIVNQLFKTFQFTFTPYIKIPIR